MQTSKLVSSSLRGATLAPRSRAAKRSVSRAIVRAQLGRKEAGLAGVSGAGVLGFAGAARAADEATVDSAIDQVVGFVKAAGEAVKAGLDAANSGVEVVKDAYEQVAPVVKVAVDATAPVVQEAVKIAADVAQPAIKAAEPSVKAGLQEASKAITSTIDSPALNTTLKTAKEAATATKPVLEQAAYFLTHTEPLVLGEYALGLVALYYLAPPLLKGTFGALRGYAGDVSPAAALDALATQGNTVLVDIRSAKEKEAAGVPDLPNNGKLVELEFATLGDKKLRAQLRNAADLELKVTAMQIAALKRLSTGTTLFIMDRNGSTAKAVAKELGKRGFGRAYVLAGGYQAWTNSKLKTKGSSVVSNVEVLEGSVWGTFSSRPKTTSGARTVKSLPASTTAVPSRRALPSSISGR